jgi:AhpD family alkylhydroperoxidase
MGISRDDVFKEIERTFGQVPAWIRNVPPTALGSLWGMMRDFQLAETVIPNKYKELIGIAVSGATRCRYCVLFHTEAARVFGATDAEIAEASMMGSFTMMASTFINGEQIDYDQFKRETLDIVRYVKQEMQKGGDGKSRNGGQAHA